LIHRRIVRLKPIWQLRSAAVERTIGPVLAQKPRIEHRRPRDSFHGAAPEVPPFAGLVLLALVLGLLAACSDEPANQDAIGRLFEEAERAANAIPSEPLRWNAVEAIASGRAGAHQDQAAREGFSRAKGMVRDSSREDAAGWTGSELVRISVAESRAGLDGDAAATMTEGLAWLRRVSDDKRRATVLIALAGEMADEGESKAALTLVDAGVEAAQGLPNKWTQSWLFRSAADVYQKLGAEQQMRRAVNLAEPGAWLEDNEQQPIALMRLAETYALQGNRKSAMEIAAVLPENDHPPIQAALVEGLAATGELEAADAAARRIAHPQSQARAFRAIAHHRLRTGSRDKAHAAAQDALSAARRMTDGTRVIVYYGIARLLLRAEDPAGAKEVLAEAMDLNQQQGTRWNMNEFIDSVLALAKSGDVSGAEKLAKMIADPAQKASALARVTVERAHAAARRGELEQARDLARSIDDPYYRAKGMLAVIEGLSGR